MPDLRELVPDGNERNLGTAIDAMKAGKSKGYSHLICATSTRHCWSRLRGSDSAVTMPALGNVGFVVIGRNEGSRLEACLRSVLAVSSQVIYADSASTDGSPALAAQLGAKVISLPDDGALTAARGRNAGFRELRERMPECELVQFLDGDCILQPHWLPAAVEFFRDHPEVAVVCGRRFEAHPDASIYNRSCDAEWNTPCGEASACGGDALIRRAALDQVHGYREELLAGEEPEMTARMRAIGWKVWRIDVPMTEHDARIYSFGQWWRRSQRGGFGYAQVWSATASLPRRLYGRQLLSALAWAVMIPTLCLLAAIIARQPLILLLLPLLYALQVARIAHASPAERDRWTRAALILLAKIPETIGAARFVLGGGRRQVPEYKRS
jgi:cellulose synthase/poly-beta-1,6-N-acetylglucosamine synthase-like glycosyltransferase